MENLLIYLMENLLKYGDVEKCNIKIAGENAFVIYIEHACFMLTRSEIMQLKSMYDERLAYMLDNECVLWNKLFNLL